MGNKFSNKYIWVLMLVLGVFVMAVTALIGGNSSIRNAQQTAQRTLQYLQNQCISYRDIVAADRLKSLVRLTEQAQEVAEREGMVGQNRSNEELARYAQRQRVTCVLVLDKDLEIEFSSGADMDWSDYYTNEAIRSIMDYPEKIFARRLTRDGAVYDIAAVARVENPGVVFCVRLQSNTIIASYRASIESLLAGYETLLNDRVYTYITDGERVVGSSAAEQWNLPVDEVPLIRALESSPSVGSELTQLRADGTFFGAREQYQQYSLYVFLPNEYVFEQGKNMVISAFGVYALAAVFATLLVLRATQERKRREEDYQHRLEEEVRRATAADQAKTSFLRSMSHDIRTPINIIMGMLEIIGREPDNRAQIQECRSKAQTASRYLLELVNDVLTLNRPEEKAALEAQTPFSLSAELGDVLLLAREQAKAAGVVLAEPELLLEHDNFTGNPLYLRQVCQNIIGNAIKYSRPGGQVRCTFREQEDSDGVCRLRFTCQDDGVGMSEEFQRRMFEAYAREDTGDTVGGTVGVGVGLGLAVVKRIVDEKGGTISVDSAKGKGTRFDITMPLRRETVQPPKARESASIDGCRLLVVEDNDLNRELAVYMLRDAGASVTEARDGRSAVDTFAASPPHTYDAVLMDVMMPETDGLTATRIIRAMDRPDADVPIIAMTANLFAEDVAACTEAGMDAHIPKPLERARMVQIIADCIGRKKRA